MYESRRGHHDFGYTTEASKPTCPFYHLQQKASLAEHEERVHVLLIPLAAEKRTPPTSSAF